MTLYSFSRKEELLCEVRSYGRNRVLRSVDISHFHQQFISRLCGNECFGAWPEHGYFSLFVNPARRPQDALRQRRGGVKEDYYV